MPRPFTDTERDRIRERLLAAARDAVRRTGMRKTAVDGLARAAGISKGAFYLFFERKEDLWIAVMGEAETRVRATLWAIVRDPAPDRLRRLLTALFELVGEDPVLAALRDPEEVAWIERALPPEALAEARRDDDRFFGALYDELVRLGDADPAHAEAFVGLPVLALGLAQQRPWLGPRDRVVGALVVDALAARLARS